MKLTWIGHSCFKVEKDGFVVVLDPYADGSVPGLAPVREKAAIVCCSHEHGDHNFRDGIELYEVSETPFTITKIDTYHDDTKGSQRGTNQIVILSDGVNRVAHLGDLGCELEPEQLEVLKGLDAMLIPVGGHYTIDATQAAALVKKTSPRIVIPMHYRNDKAGFGFDVIGTVEAFTEQMKSVITLSDSELETTDSQQAQVVVLQPKNCRK